jgi:hypothetical protein
MFCARMRSSLWAGTMVVLAVVLVGTAQPAAAQQSVVRTFGFYATGGQVGPDFTSEESKVVTALPDLASSNTGELLRFSSCDCNPEWLRGTTWVLVPAHHATKHNDAPGGAFFWLVDDDTPELPPVGANTVTGPDGMIIDQISYRIARCAGDCDWEDDDEWRVVTEEGLGAAFVVVTAWFSR